MEVNKEFEISFSSNWYNAGYYVYVLKSVHLTKGTFYYVGQTGDRHYRAARSPFYRLLAHFNPYSIKATDAQLRNGLIAKGLIETPTKEKNIRICMEEAIASEKVKINAKFYKILDFNGFGHKENRNHVEAVETALINLFDASFLFNDLSKIGHIGKITSKEQKELAAKIYKDIMKQEING